MPQSNYGAFLGFPAVVAWYIPMPERRVCVTKLQDYHSTSTLDSLRRTGAPAPIPPAELLVYFNTFRLSFLRGGTDGSSRIDRAPLKRVGPFGNDTTTTTAGKCVGAPHPSVLESLVRGP